MKETAHRPPIVNVAMAPDRHTLPFWQATADHKLLCQRCLRCRRFRNPPGPFCPGCQSQDVEWVCLSGTGTVYTYTVVRHALLPDLVPAVPYVVAAVVPDETDAVRFVANIVDVDVDRVEIGLPVVVTWDHAPELGVALYRFRPL
jgi:uncharacterized OB-fold protein